MSLMKEEVKTELVRRLRSGDYPKTSSVLAAYKLIDKTNDKDDHSDDQFVDADTPGAVLCYCFAGVLAQQAVDAGVVQASESSHLRRFDGSASFPSRMILEWAAEPGEVESLTDELWKLIDKNDNGWSFEQLATEVEATL
jgi:hypothetical protein